MRTNYTIHLRSLDLGQLLDGLENRALAWERTADYLRTEEMPEGEFFLVEECNKPEEADDCGALPLHRRHDPGSDGGAVMSEPTTSDLKNGFSIYIDALSKGRCQS